MSLSRSITIDYQMGSGGRTIAARCARRLKLPLYDNAQLLGALYAVGASDRYAARLDACDFYAYKKAVLTPLGYDPADSVIRHALTLAFETDLLCAPCVTSGMAATKFAPQDGVRVFIRRPQADRAAQLIKWGGLSRKQALGRLCRIDRAQKRLLRGADYDLTLNSSAVGEDSCVALIVEFVETVCRRQCSRGHFK